MAYYHSRKLKEPERKSILQVLRSNFSYYDRNTFVHRLIYIGKIPVNSKEKTTFSSEMILENFEASIKPINYRYCDEKITGFLLHLGQYYCHVLESSEESLVRHLKLLKEKEMLKEYFDKFKLIIVYHHMNQRFLEEWVPIDVEEFDKTVLKSIDDQATLETTTSIIKLLIQKLYAVGNSLKVKVEESKARMRTLSRQRDRLKSSLSHSKIPVDANLLPEYSDLEFLLVSSHTKPLSEYLNIYNSVPSLHNDNYRMPQKGLISEHIFEKQDNPVKYLQINNFH